MIPAAEWERAVRAIDGARAAVLACHIGPDGDALGSMLALTLALRARGVPTIASWGSDPFVVPKQYAFLPALDLLSPPAAVPAEPELMLTFDAGSIERLGDLEPNARKAKSLLVVDHHATNDRFGHVNLVDPDAAASAVVVYELLGRLGIEIDREIATCLYTGLVTDTGRFQYRNTTPEIHVIAADLLGRGVAQDEIARLVYDTHPIGYLRLAARVLERVEVVPDPGIVWTWLTQEDLAEQGLSLDDTEALIDLVRTADVADVAAILKQQPDGRFKVSMRSKGESDVGAVCESFGGGGHMLAAGFTASDGEPRRTIEEIAAALRARR